MTELINDAVDYGVRIAEADVAPGTEYWKIIRVHHLTPEENQGKHHIFLDAIDDEDSRIFNARALVNWDGGSETVVIDKPTTEPGANFPMWKWQVCSVEMQGLPSDRAESLRTDFPDEAPGNTLFHHSFTVTFQQTVAQVSGPPADSIISGQVPGGADHTLVLHGESGRERTMQVGGDEMYRFEHLVAGRYTIEDQDDGRVLGPVDVDGSNGVELDFPPVITDKPLARYLLFGPAGQPITQLHLSLLADYLAENRLSFGFSIEQAASARRVTLIGEHPESTVATLETAGAEVDQLPTEPGALLAAIRDESDN